MSEQDVMSGDQLLDYTRRSRVNIITQLSEGEAIKDPKVARTVLAALDGLDKQELGLRKIDAAERTSAAERMVAATLTALMAGKELAGVNPFEAGGPGAVPAARTVPVPALPVTEITLNPGELDVGVSGDNLQTFADRVGMRTGDIPGIDTAGAASEYGDDSEDA